MKIAAVLLALSAGASARIMQPDGDIPADSSLGKRLLSKATVVQPARHLEQNNAQNAEYWIHKYSIKYLSCSGLIQVSEENNQEQGVLYMQNLVKFALCPADSCSGCSGGGEYIVPMNDFIDAYTEAKLDEKEAACENIRENCYCDNANDDQVCENQCYTNAGMEDCIEYEGQDEFEIQRYLECAEMQNQNGNNNQNANYQYGNQNGFYGQYYVGAYCSPHDGKSILMGVFYDQGCVNRAEASVYSQQNYGSELPFSKESIVKTECMACKVVEQNNNNNQNQNQNNGQNNGNYQENYEIAEICQQSYEAAARCEESMDIPYPDTSGCHYIKNILPRLAAASRAVSSGSKTSGGGGGSSKAATAFAIIFAATTVMFGAYAYFLYRKIKRGSVNLSSQEQSMAA